VKKCRRRRERRREYTSPLGLCILVNSLDFLSVAELCICVVGLKEEEEEE